MEEEKINNWKREKNIDQEIHMEEKIKWDILCLHVTLH